jgi:HK97 gp10 family phage protein
MTTTTSYQSHRKEVSAEIAQTLAARMATACQLVERDAKKNVSKTPPNHPAVDTGRLRSSITYKVENDFGKITGLVGTNVFYGSYLEFGTSRMPPYPWLFPAAEANHDNIVKLLGDGTQRGF